MNSFNDLKKCTACDLTLNREDNFDRRTGNQFEFQSVCMECSKAIGRIPRRSGLSRRANIQIHNSHERMLDNALRQKTQTVCPIKLRGMYPYMTDHQISRMSRLNEKINAANDFLIEEQNLYLNPKERTPAGIEYRADLFAVSTDYQQDKEELAIIDEQKGI